MATDFVPQMIEFAKGIAAKHCYELESGLYFDVATVAALGPERVPLGRRMGSHRA